MPAAHDVIRLFDRELSARKVYREGTHRAKLPRETLRRARALMPRLGITRLCDITGLDSLGVPVYTAVRPNGRSLSVAQGKGLDAEAAAASALMESIEQWHAEHPVLARVRGSVRRLRARLELVDVQALPRERRARISPDATFDWVKGWDLMAERPVWVPLEAVTLDCVFPRGYRPTFAVGSNGLASGNHLLEAIVHGLCEVIERDAEARWRAERGEQRVDLDTVTDAGARAMLDALAADGTHVTIWDITSDVGAWAYACGVMRDPHEPAWRPLGLYHGFGCHLSPAIALQRAISEAIQTRAAYIAGSRDDFFPADYARSVEPELLASIWAHVRAAPDDDERVDFAEPVDLSAATFEEDVRTLLGLLRAAGAARAIVVDLSRPELGVPVVKVIVPGRATRVDLMA